MAGYSSTPLIRKLGITPGARVRLVDAPPGFERLLGPLPEGVKLLPRTTAPLDFAQLFARRQAMLRRRLPPLVRALARDGALWISWPKRTSRIETDLDRERIREIGLAAGLVDVKVCAVDDDWSGLKFVYRREDR